MGVLFLVPLILGYAGQGESRFNPWLYIASSVLMMLGALVLIGWVQANRKRVHPAFEIMDPTAGVHARGFLRRPCAGLQCVARWTGIALTLLASPPSPALWTGPSLAIMYSSPSLALRRLDRAALNAAFCSSSRESESPRWPTAAVPIMFASISEPPSCHWAGFVSGFLSDIPASPRPGASAWVHRASIIVVGAVFVVLSALRELCRAANPRNTSAQLFLYSYTGRSQALMSEQRRRVDARIEDRRKSMNDRYKPRFRSTFALGTTIDGKLPVASTGKPGPATHKTIWRITPTFRLWSGLTRILRFAGWNPFVAIKRLSSSR